MSVGFFITVTVVCMAVCFLGELCHFAARYAPGPEAYKYKRLGNGLYLVCIIVCVASSAMLIYYGGQIR